MNEDVDCWTSKSVKRWWQSESNEKSWTYAEEILTESILDESKQGWIGGESIGTNFQRHR